MLVFMAVLQKQPVPRIVVANAEELSRELSSRGYAPDSVFLKMGYKYERNSTFLGEFEEVGIIRDVHHFVTKTGIRGVFGSSTLNMQEMRTLAEMRTILPTNVVMPIVTVRESRPSANGGFYEYDIAHVLRFLEGEPLGDIIGQALSNAYVADTTRNLVNKTEHLVRLLHAHGIGHGDLHTYNIIVVNGEPILIDPLKRFEFYDKSIASDKVFLRDMKRWLAACRRKDQSASI